MSDLKVKLFAEATPEQLEAKTNAWLHKANLKLEGFDFVADGTEKAYNLCLLYREEIAKRKGGGEK